MVWKEKENNDQTFRDKVLLENLYNSIPSAIAITTPSGVVTMINSEFTNLFGYTQEDTAGKILNDLIVPDELREEANQIDMLSSENMKDVRQTVRKDKKGNRIYVSLVARGIFINNEMVANLAIYSDISTERKKQLLQDILFNISTAAIKQYDLKDIYPTIVHELSKIWDTNNFFIALYNKDEDKLSLPFFSDEKDSFVNIPTEKTITGYVIKQNKSVLLKQHDLKVLEEAGEIDLIGTPCKVWMGVPLRVDGSIIGMMCLQDYNDENKFSSDDLYVLDFIANQIALSIQRRIMLDNLIFARQKAEEAAQSKQLFMSTMSHEIRTPLNEVIGITNLLMQGHPVRTRWILLRHLNFQEITCLLLLMMFWITIKWNPGKLFLSRRNSI
ncbi:MAG: PAS domain S-box protein [Bacteroidetes bacterium]|nr:PAS domain S-box protein [Bacteroidota bacterium]